MPKFPPSVSGRAWIYLLGLPNGVVKAGRTICLRSRMARHRYSFPAEWVHIIPVAAGRVDAIESHVLCLLGRIGMRRNQTEVFDDVRVSKAELIRIVRSVVTGYMTADEFAAQKAARLARDIELVRPHVNAMLAALAEASHA